MNITLKHTKQMKKYFEPEGGRLQLTYDTFYDNSLECASFYLGPGIYYSFPKDKRSSSCICLSLNLILINIELWVILRRENYSNETT